MSHKLAVIVHENDEVTVKDGRGLPVVCKDCRFAGWLTEWEFRHHALPPRCLYHSGGADPHDGDRVIFDKAKDFGRRWKRTSYDTKIRSDEPYPRAFEGYVLLPLWGHSEKVHEHGGRYPLCSEKNHDGNCPDYVPAKPLPPKPPWWKRILGLARRTKTDRRQMRE